MTWTYHSSDLSSTDSTLQTRTVVRRLIGDTSTGDPLLDDAEIDWTLTQTPSQYLAAAECCDMISGAYARQVNTQNEGLSVSASDRKRHFAELAARWRRRACGSAGIYVGGRSQAEKDERAEDGDLVQPFFTRESDDFNFGSTST